MILDWNSNQKQRRGYSVLSSNWYNLKLRLLLAKWKEKFLGYLREEKKRDICILSHLYAIYGS